eukprot:2924979-Rhodomonas_salina.1
MFRGKQSLGKIFPGQTMQDRGYTPSTSQGRRAASNCRLAPAGTATQSGDTDSTRWEREPGRWFEGGCSEGGKGSHSESDLLRLPQDRHEDADGVHGELQVRQARRARS